jgi:hypothetical protein
MERYNRIEENAGRQNIRYIQPDCGFRTTPPEKVRLILEKMKIVADTIIWPVCSSINSYALDKGQKQSERADRGCEQRLS